MIGFSSILVHPMTFAVLMSLWLILFLWFVYRATALVARSVVSRTRTTADDKLLPIVRRSLALLAIMAAVYVVVTYRFTLTPSIHHQIDMYFWTFVSVLVGIVIYGMCAIVLIEIHERRYRKAGQEVHAAVPFLNNIVKIVVFSVVSLVILRIHNVDIAPALASAGVIGVALAFAAKDFIANLFGGLSVFFDKPYALGDYIIIDQIHRGEVQEIGMRSTKIRTRDGVLITVPNSVMVTSVVVNETGYDANLRVRVPLQVAYGSDLEGIEKTLIDIASGYQEVLKDPPPIVRFREFTDAGVSLEFLIVISDPADKGRVTHELIKHIHTRFEKERIRIPFPHREILLHKEK